MRVKAISYSESKESVNAIGLKSWNKAGVEIEVFEGDVVDAVYFEAMKIVGDALAVQYKNIPGFEMSTHTYPTSQSPLPEIDYKSKEKVEVAISHCENIQQLEQLADKALIHKLVKEYNQKKKELQ